MTLDIWRIVLLRSVRARADERKGSLPGDERIAPPLASLTNAITIARPPTAVWPWLVQMGADRAGWYSYDLLDNGGRRSARRLLPNLQAPSVGTIFPALPGVTDGFILDQLDVGRSLVLVTRSRDGATVTSWAFVLDEPRPEWTRLIVRVRATEAYRFKRLPRWLTKAVVRPVHFVMQRKQLLGIASRVEQAAAPNMGSARKAAFRGTS